MSIRIEDGDSLKVVPWLAVEGVTVDAIVTDPPYHLVARTKRFGKEGSAPPKYGRDGAMGRLSKGFMGQAWDGGDIAFRPETWATVGEILRPGGFMLVFGGTRTYHRMTCAIEDAGFVIQDCILWMYGTGFPKRRDMLKPAYEPIAVAYKPGGGRTMQIDECRIPSLEPNPSIAARASARRRGGAPSNPGEYTHTINDRTSPEKYMAEHPGELLGRWPANVCHDGSDEVVSLFPSSTARPPGSVIKHTSGKGWKGSAYGSESREAGSVMISYGDDGSAARFFWSPKASKKDRAGSEHPTVKPVALMEWLVSLVTPIGGTVLDPFAGSGTTGQAASQTGRNAILIEREPQFLADIHRRFERPIDLETAFERPIDLETTFERLTAAIEGLAP